MATSPVMWPENMAVETLLIHGGLRCCQDREWMSVYGVSRTKIQKEYQGNAKHWGEYEIFICLF